MICAYVLVLFAVTDKLRIRSSNCTYVAARCIAYRGLVRSQFSQEITVRLVLFNVYAYYCTKFVLIVENSPSNHFKFHAKLLNRLRDIKVTRTAGGLCYCHGHGALLQ